MLCYMNRHVRDGQIKRRWSEHLAICFQIYKPFINIQKCLSETNMRFEFGICTVLANC